MHVYECACVCVCDANLEWFYKHAFARHRHVYTCLAQHSMQKTYARAFKLLQLSRSLSLIEKLRAFELFKILPPQCVYMCMKEK